MILLKSDRLRAELKSKRRSLQWFAEQLSGQGEPPYSKGFISRLINNKQTIPNYLIGRMLLVTGFRFEDLFTVDWNGVKVIKTNTKYDTYETRNFNRWLKCSQRWAARRKKTDKLLTTEETEVIMINKNGGLNASIRNGKKQAN